MFREGDSWLDRPDFTDELADIDVPVLVIHGEEDIAVEPDRAEPMVVHLPDARMELIPEAGHTSNLENPEAANAAIREFLDEVRREQQLVRADDRSTSRPMTGMS